MFLIDEFISKIVGSTFYERDISIDENLVPQKLGANSSSITYKNFINGSINFMHSVIRRDSLIKLKFTVIRRMKLDLDCLKNLI